MQRKSVFVNDRLGIRTPKCGIIASRIDTDKNER